LTDGQASRIEFSKPKHVPKTLRGVVKSVILAPCGDQTS